MPFSPSSPVTGGPQTGLTSPTYTLAEDTAPVPHGKQYAVTALGGTQTGVEVNSMGNPFTITAFKVPNPKGSPIVNPVTGALQSVGYNVVRLLVRKGMESVVDQPRQIALADLTIKVPAGADINDPESIRAMMSLLAGVLWASSADIGSIPIQNTLT